MSIYCTFLTCVRYINILICVGVFITYVNNFYDSRTPKRVTRWYFVIVAIYVYIKLVTALLRYPMAPGCVELVR